MLGRLKFPDPESVTYVSERLLPMSPVYTYVIAWANGPGKTASKVDKR